MIFAKRPAGTFPTLPTDTTFFVSGSSASDLALFGGSIVGSGSMSLKNTTGVTQFSAGNTGITVSDSSGNSKFTVAAATGNTVVQGTLQSVGVFTATGGLTGSLTKLSSGGDYLVAGANITLTTGSLGQVTIAATAGGSVAGSDTQVQFNDGGSFGGDAGLTYNKSTDTLTVSGDLAVNGGDVTSSAATFNLLNSTVTTLNVGGAATAVEIGAATGTTSINNDLTVDGNTTLGNASTDTTTVAGDLAVNGGDITSSATSFNLLNGTVTNLNIGGAGTDINVGSNGAGALYLKNAANFISGTTTQAGAATFNGNVTLGDASADTVTVNGTTTFAGAAVTTTFAGDVAVNGGDITTSATTFNLVNATATTLNVGGAATTVEIGAATGTTSINNDLTVDGNTTLGNASSDTVTVAGDLAVNGGDMTSSATSFNLLNSTVTSLNLAGAGTDINVGSNAAGALYLKNATVNVSGSSVLAGAATFNSTATFNGNVTLGNATSDTVTLTARAASSFLPSADVTYDLGSSSFRWANIYTGDLHLKNERGDYTLIEEEDFLTIRFNKTGKRYKFMLEAVPELDEELGNFSSGPKG